MKKILHVLVFLFLFPGICNAELYEDANVKIWAKEVAYNKLRKIVEATGDVSVKGADFRVKGQYVKYFPATKMLIAEDQFNMEIDEYRIAGSRLEYNVVTKDGNIMIVRINFGETFLGGSFMKMDEDKYDILNAYFTGCNSPDSDYHTSSTEIVLYPKTGLIVAYWGLFWVGNIPTIPVPTFVYTAPVPEPPEKKIKKKKEKKYTIKREHEIFPTPGLGYNTEDGYFLIQPLDYYFGEHHYMRTHLSWSEAKQFGLATALNYILWTDIHEGEIRLGATNGDGTFGGLSYIFSFGPNLLSKEEKEKYVYDKYFPGNKYMYELEVNASYKERINIYKNEGPFNRVSFLPMVSLRANRNHFINKHLTYFGELNWASVSEESSNTEGQRQVIKADVAFDYDVPVLGHFQAMSEVDLRTYSGMENTWAVTYESWNTATQKLSFKRDFGEVLEIGLGHRHIYMNEGETPYDFEGYWFAPFDTLSTFAQLNLWYSSLIYDAQYDLPSQNWRSIRYGLRWGLHCYDVIADYMLLRDYEGNEWTEFTITIELTPSRWE